MTLWALLFAGLVLLLACAGLVWYMIEVVALCDVLMRAIRRHRTATAGDRRSVDNQLYATLPKEQIE